MLTDAVLGLFILFIIIFLLSEGFIALLVGDLTLGKTWCWILSSYLTLFLILYVVLFLSLSALEYLTLSIYLLVLGFYSFGLLAIGSFGVGVLLVIYAGWVWFKTVFTNLLGGRGTHKPGS